MVHSVLTDHALPDLLLPYHLSLHGGSFALHGHFAVEHSLPVPDHRLCTQLNDTLMIVSFSDDGIIPAVRP